MMMTGSMPTTDFTYEEFEGLLGSLYLTLQPLKDSPEKYDRAVWIGVCDVLDGFAARHDVRPIEEIIQSPRPTRGTWGQPKEVNVASIASLLASMWRDFGVVPGNRIWIETIDGREEQAMSEALGIMLERYHVIDRSDPKVNYTVTDRVAFDGTFKQLIERGIPCPS